MASIFAGLFREPAPPPSPETDSRFAGLFRPAAFTPEDRLRRMRERFPDALPAEEFEKAEDRGPLSTLWSIVKGEVGSIGAGLGQVAIQTSPAVALPRLNERLGGFARGGGGELAGDAEDFLARLQTKLQEEGQEASVDAMATGGALAPAGVLAAQFGANLIPLSPSARLGATGAKLAARAGLGKLGQRIAASAIPGAVEGGVVGLAQTAQEDRPLARIAKIAGMSLAGSGLGVLGGGVAGRRAGGAEAPAAPELPAQGTPGEAGFIRLGKEPSPPLGSPEARIGDYADKNLVELSKIPERDGETLVEQLRRQWTNRDAPLEDLGGETMRHAVQRARGAPAAAELPFTQGVFQKDADGGLIRGPDGKPVRLARSLREILADVDTRDLNVLLHSEQYLERVAKGFKGTRAGEAKAAQIALGEKHGFTPEGRVNLRNRDGELVADELRDWLTKTTIDPLIEVGRLTADDKGRMLEAHEFYAPMRRVLELIASEEKGLTGSGNAGRYQSTGKPIRRRLSTEDAEDTQEVMPLDAMLERIFRVQSWVERQRVAQTLSELAERDADVGAVVTRAKVQPRPIRVGAEELAEKGIDADSVPAEGLTLWRPAGDQPPGTFVSYRDGKPVYYEAPQEVIKALRGNRPREANILGRMAGAVTRTLRAGSVFAPQFIGVNVFRDQPSAFFYTPGLTYKPGLSAVRGLAEVIGKGDHWKEYVASGAAHGTLVSADRQVVDRVIREALGKQPGWLKYGNPIETLRTVSESMEEATRVGIFLEARKRGLPVAEARDLSREGIIDFSRKGEVGEVINRYEAFFNARLQGLSKFVRTFGEDPVKAAKGDRAALKRSAEVYAKVLGAVTAPSVALWVKNHDDPEYQRIPQWQKDLFWHIDTFEFRGERYWIRFPKPFEIGWVFGTAPERFLDWVSKSDPEGAAAALRDFAGELLPVPLTTAGRPVLENEVNYQLFFDKPVVPHNLEHAPAELQAHETTSPALQKLARLSTAAGLDNVPVLDQLASPLQAQNLLYGWTGSLGREGLRLADKGMAAAGLVDGPAELPMQPTEVPVVGGFARGLLTDVPLGSGTESLDRFYAHAKRIDALDRQIRNLKGRDRERAKELTQGYPEYRLATYMRRKVRQLGTVSDRIRATYRDERLTPEERLERVRELQLRQTELAESALEYLDRLRRNPQ